MAAHLNPVLLNVGTELIGARVTLRAFRDEDALPLWNAIDRARAHLKRWMPWVDEHNDLAFSQTYVRRMQAKWLLREDFPMAIWRSGDGELLGATGLHRIDWAIPSMEMGYWLTPAAEGKGYATEAARLLIRFAFESLRAERLVITCDSRNKRSAAVPERLSFTLEGTLRDERRDTAGMLSDTALFAMTRADFDKASQGTSTPENQP